MDQIVLQCAVEEGSERTVDCARGNVSSALAFRCSIHLILRVKAAVVPESSCNGAAHGDAPNLGGRDKVETTRGRLTLTDSH